MKQNGTTLSVKTVKASQLVEDFDLYPRKDVDSVHITQIADAISIGEVMPPIVACKKTKRIADGFHRRRAFIRLHGPDAEVPVIWKTYANDGELFLDAMLLNSGHGRKLTSVDVVRAATKAKAFGLDEMTVAKALHMSVERVGALVVDRSATSAGGSIAIKRTVRHMAGQKFTPPQVEANKKLSGMNQVFYANQIITLIENGMLDTANEELLSRLRHLGTLIAGL